MFCYHFSSASHETTNFITFINGSPDSKVEFKYRLTIYAMPINYVDLEPNPNKHFALP